MRRGVLAFTIVMLLGGVVGLQALLQGQAPGPLPPGVTGNLLYVQSPEFLRRASLSFDSLVADVYWIRTVQHFGRTKLSQDRHKQYDLLYPLLDLTTSLDPHFNIAYRFGAVFLAEQHPSGAGRPDLAIALLEKGLRAQPARWEFAQDIGFVHYWWLHDYKAAANWFTRAANMPGGPNWMGAMAAVTLAQGGNRDSSRRLWQEMLNSREDWLRTQARFRLTQLTALDQIDALQRIVRTFEARAGRPPRTWTELVAAGYLRRVPVDPEGHQYELNPYWGLVTLGERSPLHPLPTAESAR